eukprot:TRINITY_DN941_c0_g1_i1.p1 TRINITY_DN941_c0_g1~~TRINITY_DN941_c0_g1_i1.p1  ORF type:complete len:262 (+),score=61.46 TRINITY_DN941_c0_g1_i1:45-830(+)
MMHQKIENGVNVGGWDITSLNKQPIPTSYELELIQEQSGLQKIPDMMFDKNIIRFRHVASGFELNFNPIDAIKYIKKEHDTSVRVGHSADWAKGRKHEFMEKTYDWTFTTSYKGSIIVPPSIQDENKQIGVPVRTDEQININKLKAQDPILFYDDVLLYEDELGDNGDSALSVRARVMPSLFFVLLRFWLRVDHVIFRVYDTRIYHEFGKNYFIREVQIKEHPYDDIKRKYEKQLASLHDHNIIAAELPLKEMYTEKIQFQ